MNQLIRFKHFHWALFALSFLCSPLFAAERITHFHSDIEVLENRNLEVTETISVISEHQAIKRGIYRDLPTIYPHPKWAGAGIREKTTFKIHSVTLDGQASPWHQVSLANGIRVFIGDENQFISRGAHQYEIQYTSEHQLSSEEGNDFLNWNVNGQGWSFPTDKVSANVRLPEGLLPIYYDAWTGRTGSVDKNYLANAQTDGSVLFNTSQALNAYEGMTISVQLPKGIVAASSAGTGKLLKDNWKWLSGLALLLLMPFYYIKAWLEVGRDPNKGVVVADYHPVRKMSPAAHHFISRNRTSNTTFAAALMNMAVKGYVKIHQTGKKSYTVEKTTPTMPAEQLSKGEHILYAELFKGTSNIDLSKGYEPKVARAKRRLGSFLKQEWRDAIYQNNQRYSWIGLTIGLVALALCALHLANAEIKVGHLLPLFIFAFIGIGFSQQKPKPVLLVPAAFFVFAGLQNSAFSLFNSSIMIWLSLFVAALFLLFHYLLKAPTPFGQKVLDEIEGFRLYLATAEQNRLDVLHPPEKTPELFEKLLPYAIALGVENQWGEQFTEVFKQHAEQQGRHSEYSPGWYSGGHYGRFNSSSFGAALGAGLASSVAAASTAPSSSSSGGFSGGAGGGGGGGGGGGW
ncbi:MAG: DUF2207 domain-containing protein [Arenicellales bacterium]